MFGNVLQKHNVFYRFLVTTPKTFADEYLILDKGYPSSIALHYHHLYIEFHEEDGHGRLGHGPF